MPAYAPPAASLLALANTWTQPQTHTPAANSSALVVTGFSLTGANAQSILDLAGTWNTTGAPTALKINVTDTASQAASLLMDLQVGGVSRFNVDKLGQVNGVAAAPSGYGLQVGSTNFFGWSTSNPIGSADTALFRDAAYTIAQRSGINAQTFRVYQTFTDALNYARAAINNTAGQVELAAESAGTGTANIDVKLTPKGTGNVSLPGGTLLKTAAALTNGAAAQTATLTNGPTAGNPTKWIPINDAGVTRYIPAW